jgi:hypothetical protein
MLLVVAVTFLATLGVVSNAYGADSRDRYAGDRASRDGA